MPKVLSKHHSKSIPPGAVDVSRPSKWGNPFMIGRDGTREEVIEKYRARILQANNPLLDDIEELRGRNLVCWCAPNACHADVLMELANKD